MNRMCYTWGFLGIRPGIPSFIHYFNSLLTAKSQTSTEHFLLYQGAMPVTLHFPFLLIKGHHPTNHDTEYG